MAQLKGNPMKKTDLKPFSNTIQVCPDCGKLDVYKDDNHTCDRQYEQQRQLNDEHYD